MSENLFETYQKNLEQLSELTDLQKKVLASSLKLFAKKGFAATSTADIAKLAGVSTGSVYKQFPTKDALLAAVLAPMFSSVLEQSVEEFLAAGLTREQSLEVFVKSFVSDRLSFISENLEIMELVDEQMMTNPQFLAAIKAVIGGQIEKEVLPQLDSLMERGEMEHLPYDVILQSILGTIHGYFGKLHMGLVSRSLSEEIDYTSKLIIKALRAD